MDILSKPYFSLVVNFVCLCQIVLHILEEILKKLLIKVMVHIKICTISRLKADLYILLNFNILSFLPSHNLFLTHILVFYHYIASSFTCLLYKELVSYSEIYTHCHRQERARP